MSGNHDHHTSGKYHIKPCSLRKNIVFPKPELKSEMAIVSSRFSIIYGEVDGGAIIYCFRDGLSMFFSTETMKKIAMGCEGNFGSNMGHQWIHRSVTTSKPYVT
jgi:hypothetical protein